MGRETKYCDVCHTIIFLPICENCGFDNSYQFYECGEDNIEEINDFAIDNYGFDDDSIISAIEERFGVDIETAIRILENYDDGMSIDTYLT